MPISDEVAAHLSHDVIVQEALARGIVNRRALARWLIDNGVPGSEEAVLSAIRRHAETGNGTRLKPAYELLSGAHLNIRSGMCVILLDKRPTVQKELPRLFEAVDYSKGEALRVIHGKRSIKVILDEMNQEPVVDMVPDHHVQEVLEGLAEVHLVADNGPLDVPGVFGLISTTLGLAGINIVEIVCGSPEVVIVVQGQKALQAYEKLDALVDRAGFVAEP